MRNNKGIIITLIAGISWGFSGCCGQYIFDTFQANSAYLTTYRMFFAGVVLILVGLLTDSKNMGKIWKDKKAVGRLFIFAVLGIMFNQYSYLTAIANSNSGTATILQYTGPVLVMIMSCFLARKLPQKKEVFAIVMVVLGTFLIATHGNIHTMVLTPAGLTWGLLSAVALACYTMLPGQIIEKYGSITITGYGMLLGSISLFFISKAWNAPMIPDFRCILAFAAIVIVGAVIPFTMYLMGVNLCGAVKASMLASIEPVSATVIMVLWLKEPFQFIDLIGFACIFTTIFLLAKKDENEKEKTSEIAD